MTLVGKVKYVSGKTGTKKDGNPWQSLKFLDSEGEEFFTAFVSEDLFNQCTGLAKGTDVQLTLNLVPGQKYYELSKIQKL